MAARKSYPILFIALVTSLLLLLSACGSTGTGSGSGLTPADVLQKSVDAMKQLKSAHMELQSTDKVQATQGSSSSPTGLTVSLKGKGDEQLPDEQFNITVNPNVTLAEIVKGDKVYVQNTQGKWYVLDKSVFENAAGNTNPFAGVSFDQNSLLGILQHLQIVDHGDETLNGQSLRHITANLDKSGLKDLINQTPQLKSAIGNVNIDTILNSTKKFQSSVDVWIDESQFYVHRTEFKISLTADTGAFSATPTPTTGTSTSTASLDLDSIVDLSKFNQTVTITPPTDATPTSDPSVIFSGVTQ